jgi:hypothetical protein
MKRKSNKEKQSASYGVKCPEAVLGQIQTGLMPADFKKKWTLDTLCVLNC